MRLHPFEAPIIALHGASGAGKTTAAERLLGHRALRLSFADPVKEFLQVVFNLESTRLWGPSERRNAHIILSPQEWATARMRFNAHAYEWTNSIQLHRHLALIDWFEATEDHYYRAGHRQGSAAFNARFLCRSLAEDWGCTYDRLAWVRVMAGRIHKRLSATRFGPAATGLVVIDDARKAVEVRAVRDWGGCIAILRPSTLTRLDMLPSEIEVYSREIEALSHVALVVDDPASLRIEQDWRFEERGAHTSREDADTRQGLIAALEALAEEAHKRAYAGQCDLWLRSSR